METSQTGRNLALEVCADVAALGGLVSVVYGAWLFSHAAGFIVGGALMSVLGLRVGSKR